MQLLLALHRNDASTADDKLKVNLPVQRNKRAFLALPAMPIFLDTGIVLFYHIPKTGGTTVRNNLQQHGNVTVFRALRRKDIATMDQLVEAVLERSRKHVLFIELHGNMPGLPDLQQQLQNWRRRAAQQNIPFFAFTLLREPVAFHVSYFVHFHSLGCHWNWCERQLYDTSRVDALLQHAIQPHHQCHILWYGQRGNKQRSATPQPISSEQCRRIHTDYLANDWDWVGTTEQLQNVTLPLLAHMLFQNASLGREMPAWNQRTANNNNTSTPLIRVGDLNETTRQMIQAASSWDVTMYNNYRHRERMVMLALSEMEV